MLLIKCVNAYAAIASMSEQQLDYQTAHALVALKSKLQPHVDFFTAEEMKLVEEYAKRDADGKIQMNPNGTFSFEHPERGAEYAQRRAKLGGVDVQDRFEVQKVPRPATIKPICLEALQDFIDFGGEEG